jgi:hypothetical protein
MGGIYINVPYSASFTQAQATLPRPLWLELLSKWMRYNCGFFQDAGTYPGSYWTGLWSDIEKYKPVGSQPSTFRPKIGCYECGWQWIYGTPQQHADYWSDPEYYYLMTAFLEMLQLAGVNIAHRYAACFPIVAFGGYAVLWGDYHWAGQQPGDGANNLYCAQTKQNNDLVNGSPGGKAFLDWCTDWNG